MAGDGPDLPGDRWLADDRSHLYDRHGIDPAYDDPTAYGPSASAFGEGDYPPDWDARVTAVRQHYGHDCGRCGRDVVAEDLPSHVHHARPLSEGGTNDLDNLVLLCEPCHALVHPDADVGDHEAAPLYPAADADPRVAVERRPVDRFEREYHRGQRALVDDPGVDPGHNEYARSPATIDAPAVLAVRGENPDPGERCDARERRRRRRREASDRRERAAAAVEAVDPDGDPNLRSAPTVYPDPLEPGLPPPAAVPDPAEADTDHERRRRETERARRRRIRAGSDATAGAAGDGADGGSTVGMLLVAVVAAGVCLATAAVVAGAVAPVDAGVGVAGLVAALVVGLRARSESS